MVVVPTPTASGTWPSTPMSEVEGDPGNYAIHYTSSVIESVAGEIWQQFGFLLNDGNAYDLSDYDGILFCGKRESSDLQSLSLRLTTYAADPEDEEIYPAEGALLPSDWGLVKLPFDSSWPITALEEAKNLEFIGDNGVEYDIWIDDVALYSE